MRIVSYKEHGRTKYKFRAFLGTDAVTGKQRRVYKSGFDTKKEAELAYLSIKSEMPLQGSETRFKSIYTLWLQTYRLGVKESTLFLVTQVFTNHILPAFGDKRIADITVSQVQQFVNEQMQSSTGRNRINYLRRIFDFARKHGYVKENPVDLVEIPRIRKQKHDANFYTKEELSRFFELAEEKVPHMWFVFFRVLAYTGMRRGEAIALTWDDIDFSVPSISINKTLSRVEGGYTISDTPKTSKSTRTILIDNETAAMLDSLPRKSKFVFTDNGGFIQSSRPVDVMHRIVDGTGLKYISPHGFRHTHCSMLFSAGVPIPEVQDRLGHSSVQTTLNIYNHIYKQDRTDALDKFMDYIK